MESTDHWKDAWKDLLPEDIQRISHQLETQPLSIAGGGVMKRFEKAYAQFAGNRYAVATNNGTAALFSALWAAGVEAGDEVLVCDYGFVAMAGAIATLKAIMVPVDMDADTLTIDVADLKRKITPRSKVVLVHNPWGVPADLAAIRETTSLPLILDASHAHGATYCDKPIAAWADISCYSLGMGKLISGGELGCAVTDNAEYRDRMIMLGHTNRTPFDLITGIWNGNNIGLKFRPHVMALEIALSQMRRFEQKKTSLIGTCRRIEDIFSEFGFIPQGVPRGGGRVYWRIVFRLDRTYWKNRTISEVEPILKQANLPVESNPYSPLLQYQAPFLWSGNEGLVRHEPCPVSAEISRELVLFPAPVSLGEDQFAHIRGCLEQARNRVESGVR